LISGSAFITVILKLTSAGTMGALTAVAASSPFKAPTTASAISMATPSCRFLKTFTSNEENIL
jgi:hypothetical protein